MPKNSMRRCAILAVSFALISVVLFAIPVDKTTSFWVAYAFTAAAFAAQVPIWRAAFGEGEARSRFLGLPVAYVGVAYLVAQTAALAVFSLVPAAPTWTAVAACVAMAGAAALCLVSADAAADEIGHTDARAQAKRLYLGELRASVELLANREADPAAKEALEQLADKIRFSDPMSHEQLAGLEEQIAIRVSELGSAADKTGAAGEIGLLLRERNEKCRILK